LSDYKALASLLDAQYLDSDKESIQFKLDDVRAILNFEQWGGSPQSDVQ
jgi:hypothetical protein